MGKIYLNVFKYNDKLSSGNFMLLTNSNSYCYYTLQKCILLVRRNIKGQKIFHHPSYKKIISERVSSKKCNYSITASETDWSEWNWIVLLYKMSIPLI